jgi:ASC-1-like (ASCH) protein
MMRVMKIMNLLSPILKLTLQTVYFEQIKSGKKTVEGRLLTQKYLAIKVNDIIRFESNQQFVDVKVTHLNKYSNFKMMLAAEGLQSCLPGIKDINEGVAIYHSFPSYRENEKVYGVIAIGIKLLNPK